MEGREPSTKEGSLRLQGLSFPSKSIPIQEGGCVCREENNTLRGGIRNPDAAG